MEGLFVEILNMSISASWLILAVILVRFLLGNAPKGFRYALWALVAIRLICPFSIESAFSLIPSSEMVGLEQSAGENTGTEGNLALKDDLGVSGDVDMNDDLGANANTGMNNSAGMNNDLGTNNNSGREDTATVDGIIIVTAIWSAGIVLLLAYAAASYVGLWRKVRISIRVRENVWMSDEIQSPFILGVIKPRIYLPSRIEREQMDYILVHEKEHIRCLDYLWKPLGFGILALHWFNPLVWIAYILMCRDIELACDERVIRRMDAVDKRIYSEVLLACSSPRHLISACPVAFGEIGIKERIKRIITYKKPAVWIVGITVVVCIIVGVCFMTDPKDEVQAGGEDVESESNTESKPETEFESNTDTSSQEEVEVLTERVLYETTADVTQDGIKEHIEVVMQIWSKEKDPQTDFWYYGTVVKVFRGRENGGYEQEPLYVSEELFYSHAGNGTIVLTHKDGKDYLMYSVMDEHQGAASYRYHVFYIDHDGKKVVVDEDGIGFANSEYWGQWETMPHRDEVVPAFREKMTPWIEVGSILIALDVDTEVFMSTTEAVCPASEYYDIVWARKDELMNEPSEETSYKKAYLDVVNAYWDRYQEDVEKMRFGLLYVDEDEIPELVLGTHGQTCLWTYAQGTARNLFYNRLSGFAGVNGYYYLPKQNVLFFKDQTGPDNGLYFEKIRDNEMLVNYYEEALEYKYIIDQNGDGQANPDEWDGNIYYFYGGEEITEEEFQSYIIGSVFIPDALEPEGYEELYGDMTIEEILEVLK